MAILAVGLGSCKKNKTITLVITGEVTDEYTGGGVANASVELEVQELTGGTFSSGFNHIETVTTDANGNYRFEFERRNASEYRITLSKDEYFGQELSINPDDLTTNSDNVEDFELIGKSWLRVRIQNSTPFDANDQVTYQVTSGGYACGTGCCGISPFTLFGTNVDTTFTCINSAEHSVTVTGFYVKNSIPGQVDETVFMNRGDTIDVLLAY